MDPPTYGIEYLLAGVKDSETEASRPLNPEDFSQSVVDLPKIDPDKTQEVPFNFLKLYLDIAEKTEAALERNPNLKRILDRYPDVREIFLYARTAATNGEVDMTESFLKTVEAYVQSSDELTSTNAFTPKIINTVRTHAAHIYVLRNGLESAIHAVENAFENKDLGKARAYLQGIKLYGATSTEEKPILVQPTLQRFYKKGFDLAMKLQEDLFRKGDSEKADLYVREAEAYESALEALKNA